MPAIPGFAILAKIGEGGMGTVYRARELATDREVAIKVVCDAGADERTRFEREVRVMAGSPHENIVGVIAHGAVEDCRYLVMELVDGRSLREVLADAGGVFPPPRVSALLQGVAAALKCLHDRQIVHRDLKPSNILLAADDRVMLTDFGISSPVAELGDITRTNEFVGSLDYMSPEQRTRLPVDERADQFALGVIAYELLTGRRPVGSFKPPSRVNGRLHASVDAVVARALQEDPDDRYPDVAAFVEAMVTALARPPQRRRAGVLVAVGAAAVVALTWVWSAKVGGRTQGAPRGDAAAAESEGVDWVALGERQLAAGNLEAATKAFDEAVRLDAANPAVYQRRALAHKMNGMFQLALDDLRVARSLDPELVDALVGEASIHVNLREFEEAIALLDEAISKAPDTADAYAWRGWAYHGVERNELAAEDLDKAIELDPDLGIAYQWRGALAKQRRDWAAVRRDYAACARCNPLDPTAHRLIASFLALCSDHELRDGRLAVEHATRACELTGWQSWGALRVLAYAQAEAGDVPAAIDSCDRALALAPENRRNMLLGQKARYESRLRK